MGGKRPAGAKLLSRRTAGARTLQTELHSRPGLTTSAEYHRTRLENYCRVLFNSTFCQQQISLSLYCFLIRLSLIPQADCILSFVCGKVVKMQEGSPNGTAHLPTCR